MFGTTDPQLLRAQELHNPPPKGQAYSVPLAGSETESKSAIYRHWRFTDKPLLDTLVPEVRRLAVTLDVYSGFGADYIPADQHAP
jgi:long-chain acyl-CoA synthetase